MCNIKSWISNFILRNLWFKSWNHIYTTNDTLKKSKPQHRKYCSYFHKFRISVSNCFGKKPKYAVQWWKAYEVYLLRYLNSVFSVGIILQRIKCLWGLQTAEQLKRERSGKLSFLKDEIFCRAGRKAGLKSLKCVMIETFFLHRLIIRLWIISMQIKYKGLWTTVCREKILWLLEIQYWYEANCLDGYMIKRLWYRFGLSYSLYVAESIYIEAKFKSIYKYTTKVTAS